MRMIKKFGGSSLADLRGCAEVRDIVQADPACKAVIVSAPGTHAGETVKMTDTLIKIAELQSSNPREAERLARAVKERFRVLGGALNVTLPNGVLDQIPEEFPTERLIGKDFLASRGEFIMGHLMAQYLGFHFVDAAEVIRFHADGKLDAPTTYQLVRERCAGPGRYLFPGFYGATRKEEVRTFSRGGSDITMAIVARALRADRAEKWTDVEGVFEASPKIIPHARVVPCITYAEMRELAAGGASVLHPDVILHVQPPESEPGIPVFVRHTRDPSGRGTEITDARRSAMLHPVVGIAIRSRFLAFNIHELGLNEKPHYGEDLFGMFAAKLGISFTHTVTSQDAFKVVIAEESLHGVVPTTILEELRHLSPTGHVFYASSQSVIAVVGLDVSGEVLLRAMKALVEADIRVGMVSHGAAANATILTVADDDATRAVEALHEEFFSAAAIAPTSESGPVAVNE